ncbi:helix-turn-helix domain-containing protein [Alkalicoccobacillus porphyridii]|uniref:Helix-turn-helix domain-containing protein n=1 Tax=Alkalicoccobacillus porphyridii TaxID=2597270 RepID=A0A554A0J2_9BACI|nr:helix-turn-helix domain-containing protein [Alkalicoccobacillus porphyridii]TSB47212.1 helix-turn-helix domain-containing protein [Alkalicoccobacillus porphyridii]
MIGNQVKKCRLAKGLSLSELAENAGVAKSYLSSIERNIQSNPSIHFLEKISVILNVPIETLLYEKSATEHSDLDNEWLELVREAKASGISQDQFREFLEFNRWRKDQSKQQ